MKKGFISVFSIIFIIVLTACGADASGDEVDSDHIVVGVTAGPHEEIMEKVKDLAAEQGLEVELKVFTDYVIPNTALHEGELDANVYQHQPFLNNFNEDKGLNLVSIGKAVNFPMGIYSEKINNIKDLQEGGTVGFPSISTGAPRALKLFESAGIIELKDGVKNSELTVDDIVKNPKNLEFEPLDAAQIPSLLGELSIAAINTNYATEAGLVPTEDALVIEPKDSPWVNVIATREELKDDPTLKKLVDIYHSPEVKQFIKEKYNGSVIPSW
ncbi:MetQ/NlpA family ABC transporter substrate-binding protein [Virgibacillus siamensis]|uniref:Lipoprotein n=1 Tax=Virgibacillus siamensis TaxID=480071 RepID=A0ABN1FI98_9BACI